VSVIRPTVSDEITLTVKRALAKSPADRFATAEEFGQTLNVALATPTALKVASRKKPTRLIAALSFVAVAVAAVLALLLRGPTDTGPPSIAVLPPLTPGSVEDPSFAEGVAEAVHLRLRPVSGLMVKARYTAKQYDIRGKSYGQIGDELGVDYMVKLSAHREETSDETRTAVVSAELIRASDEYVVWNDQYEEPLESYMVVNRAIAEQVVLELDIHLAAPEREALQSHPTTSLRAWEHFEDGLRWFHGGVDHRTYREAAQRFKNAIAADTGFTLAWGWLAYSYFTLTTTSGGQYQKETHIDSGLTALERARWLDPELSMLDHIEGMGFYATGQYGQAADLFHEALKAEPSNPDLLTNMGEAQRRLGKWGEALASLERVGELDPRSPTIMLNIAITHQVMRHYDESDRYLERALNLDPEPLTADAWWIRSKNTFLSGGDVAATERVLRSAAQRFGMQSVLRDLVNRESQVIWFELPNWGFREDLKAFPPDSLEANVTHGFLLDYYYARAISEQVEGNSREAQAYFDSVLVYADLLNSPVHLSYVFAVLGRKDDAIREALRAYQTRTVGRDAYRGPASLMCLTRAYIMVGEHEKAIANLDTLMSNPSDYSIALLSAHPLFDPLRDNPRFQALLNEN